MNPHLYKIPANLQNSFNIRLDKLPAFPGIWHYHPELELQFVIKGEGIRLIGDNISNFSPGEIILLGENLPHSWQSRTEYFQKNSGLRIEAMVLHFLPTCLGRDFLALPETYLIPKLLEKAKKGIIFYGKTNKKIAQLMHAALNATNLDRIIIFLSIIKILCESKEYKNIAFAYAFYKSNESDTLRINKVCSYTIANYKKHITIEEVATISNLSDTSFCRYFKLMTKKTYYKFLTEIRISHACKYLIEDKLPTNVICFQCGFNNISNFYRHFKNIIGTTPFHYKRKYSGNKNIIN